jgi:hypothetical protein
MDIPGSNRKPPVNPKDPSTGYFTSRSKLTMEQQKVWDQALERGDKFPNLALKAHYESQNKNIEAKKETNSDRSKIDKELHKRDTQKTEAKQESKRATSNQYENLWGSDDRDYNEESENQEVRQTKKGPIQTLLSFACLNYKKGYCAKGDKCSFKHGDNESSSQTPPSGKMEGIKRVGDLQAYKATIRHEGNTVVVGLYRSEDMASKAREYALRRILGGTDLNHTSKDFIDVDVALEKIGFPRLVRILPQMESQDSEPEGTKTKVPHALRQSTNELKAGTDLDKVKFTHRRVCVSLSIESGGRGIKTLQEILKRWEDNSSNSESFKQMDI